MTDSTLQEQQPPRHSCSCTSPCGMDGRCVHANNKRTIKDIPEGGCWISNLDKYKVIDCPDSDKKLGEGVTREWYFHYSKTNYGQENLSSMPTFIVHAETKEGAFEHFCSLFPNTFVKRMEYIGIYW